MSVTLILLGLAAYAVLMLIGFFIVSMMWPEGVSGGLKFAFAPVVGSGVCSFIYIVFRRPMFTIELTLLSVLAIMYFFGSRSTFALPNLRLSHLPASFFWLALGLGIAVSQMFVFIEREPHGDWDATAIWNSHARVLYRDGPAWESHIINTSLPDYPLMVPTLVARLWRYIGSDSPDAAGMAAALFVITVIAVLVGVLAELRKSSVAAAIALVLIGTPFFIHYGVSQAADVPLSLYILSTIALICLHRTKSPDTFGLMILVGFTAGCAAWVKNEGLLFLLFTALVLCLPILGERTRTLRRLGAFAAGAVLPLLIIVWFKLMVAPPNYFMKQRHFDEVLTKLDNPERYVLTLQNFWHTFWGFGEWLIHPAVFVMIYLAVFGIDKKMIRNAGWLQGLFICMFVLSGYFFVYILTPIDLQLHIDTSLPRLYLHLWPTGLLLAGLAIHES